MKYFIIVYRIIPGVLPAPDTIDIKDAWHSTDADEFNAQYIVTCKKYEHTEWLVQSHMEI